MLPLKRIPYFLPSQVFSLNLFCTHFTDAVHHPEKCRISLTISKHRVLRSKTLLHQLKLIKWHHIKITIKLMSLTKLIYQFIADLIRYTANNHIMFFRSHKSAPHFLCLNINGANLSQALDYRNKKRKSAKAR